MPGGDIENQRRFQCWFGVGFPGCPVPQTQDGVKGDGTESIISGPSQPIAIIANDPGAIEALTEIFDAA